MKCSYEKDALQRSDTNYTVFVTWVLDWEIKSFQTTKSSFQILEAPPVPEVYSMFLYSWSAYFAGLKAEPGRGSSVWRQRVCFAATLSQPDEGSEETTEMTLLGSPVSPG